jgi:hypothetical protein
MCIYIYHHICTCLMAAALWAEEYTRTQAHPKIGRSASYLRKIVIIPVFNKTSRSTVYLGVLLLVFNQK